MFGPAVCSLAAVFRVRSSAMQRSAHYSGCRLARDLDVHPYVSAPAVTGQWSSGTMTQLSARHVVLPVVRLLVALPMVLGSRRGPCKTEEAHPLQARSASRLPAHGTWRDIQRHVVSKMCRYGKVALFMAMSHVTVGILHRFTTSLHKVSVASERRPLWWQS
jgi:hypothetical protein